MINGTLTNYNIEQPEGAQPYHAKPLPVPKIHRKTLKQI